MQSEQTVKTGNGKYGEAKNFMEKNIIPGKAGKVYHRVFNPKMETMQDVVTSIDNLDNGWKLISVIPITEWEWVAIFESPKPSRRR